MSQATNGIRGYGFVAHPDGAYGPIPGTCPAPWASLDWSAGACIEAGDCGCAAAREAEPPWWRRVLMLLRGTCGSWCKRHSVTCCGHLLFSVAPGLLWCARCERYELWVR